MFYRLFYPRQTCMLAVSHEGKSNVTVVDWMTPVSVKPPMLAVALNNKSYSLELASASKTFSVSVVPESMKEKALGAGSATGRVIDKLEEYGLKLKNSKASRAPLLDGALAWAECEVQAIFNAGDHSIVIGEVVETHFPDEEAGKTPMLFNWGNKNYFGLGRDWKEKKEEDMRLMVVKQEAAKEEKKEEGKKEEKKEEKKESEKKETPASEKKESSDKKEEKKEEKKDSEKKEENKKEKESSAPAPKEESKKSS
ncbi:Flavin reductase like domain protein [uncultured archaeon]|nr:Flavin reductase like domain protein [uncultured archaeon]